MASGVNELLDMLFEMVDEAKNVPLSADKCMVERDKALDLIDEIRGAFPAELAEAKKLLNARTSCWPRPSGKAKSCAGRQRRCLGS